MCDLKALNNYDYGIVTIDKYQEYQKIPDYKLKQYPWMRTILVFIFPLVSDVVHYERYLVARYAYGEDYHQVVSERLEKIAKELKLEQYLVMTDVSFFDEKLLCYLAGLGAYGKNNLIINEKYGTNFVIGEIVTNLVLDYHNTLLENPCDDCNICLQACPTKAINNEGFNRKKCLSYLTQYRSDEYPLYDKVLRSPVGCDICQDVCPKNHNKTYQYDERFKIDSYAYINLSKIQNLDKDTFKEKYSHKAFNWIGYLKMLRNILTLEVNNKNIELETIDYYLEKYRDVKWFYNHLNYLKGKLINGKN